jgi:hypothetical protein
MLGILLIVVKLVAWVAKLLLRLLLIPVKIVVAGIMLNLGMLLVFLAVLAVVGYFIYQWLT